MSRTRAVVFDLDGTLVDSMLLVLRAFAHALRPYCGELTPAEITSHLGGPPDRMLRKLIADESKVPEAMQHAYRDDQIILVRFERGIIDINDLILHRSSRWIFLSILSR